MGETRLPDIHHPGDATVNKRYNTAINHPGIVSESKTKFSIRMNLGLDNDVWRKTMGIRFMMDKLVNKPIGKYSIRICMCIYIYTTVGQVMKIYHKSNKSIAGWQLNQCSSTFDGSIPHIAQSPADLGDEPTQQVL